MQSGEGLRKVEVVCFASSLVMRQGKVLKPKLSRTSFQCLSESASVSPRNASAAIADGTLAAPDEPIAGRDGRVCLTNNAARRALRGIALGCRNWPAPVPSAGPIVPPSCHPITLPSQRRRCQSMAFRRMQACACRLRVRRCARPYRRSFRLPPARITALAMGGTQSDGYRGGRVNSARNNASERSKPSSVRINDFDLLTGSPINPFL